MSIYLTSNFSCSNSSGMSAALSGPKKTIIIGDSNVGKTSILLRLVRNEFDDQSMPTLGAGFKTKEMTYYNV